MFTVVDQAEFMFIDAFDQVVPQEHVPAHGVEGLGVSEHEEHHELELLFVEIAAALQKENGEGLHDFHVPDVVGFKALVQVLTVEMLRDGFEAQDFLFQRQLVDEVCALLELDRLY